MRVALNQSCFPGLTPARFVEVAAAAGAATVDLRPLDPAETPRALVAAVRSSGLPVGAIHALMDWALPDDPDPRPALDALLEVAVATGAPLIICVAPLRPAELPPSGVIARSAAERLAAMAEVARDAGVRLALEQVGRSSSRPKSLSGIRRLADAARIATAAGADVVLAVDSYNLATADEGFDEIMRVPAARIGVAHVADRDAARGVRVLPGLGDLDLDLFAHMLARSGYEGALSLEIFPTAPWPDPLAVARQAVADLRRLIEQGGAEDHTRADTHR